MGARASNGASLKQKGTDNMLKIKITTGLGFTKEGRKINANNTAEALKQAQKALSEAFGGCTMQQGEGAWLNDEGKLVVEPVICFEACFLGINEPIAQALAEQAAADLRDALGQQCVVFEVLNVNARMI